MAKDVELRKFVERLIAGDFRSEYLTRLYLALRRRSFGAVSVVEIGNAIGHEDEVDRGFATSEARDIFKYFQLIMPFWGWQTGGKKLDAADLPPKFTYFLMQNFRRLDPSKIKECIGLKQKATHLALQDLIAKFATKPNGRMFLAQPITEQEKILFQYVHRTMVLRSLFTDESIHRDLLFALEKNKLLETKERNKLGYLKQLLVLNAIERFNKVQIALDEKDEEEWKALLYISLLSNETSNQLLGLSIYAKFPPDLHGIGGLSHAFISTTMMASDWCSTELVSLLQDQLAKGEPQHISVELNADRKLDCL